jgi:hypothetical protein
MGRKPTKSWRDFYRGIANLLKISSTTACSISSSKKHIARKSLLTFLTIQLSLTVATILIIN